MFTKLLVVLLLIDALVLVAAILLQSGKGGGMAASFGGASSSSDQFLGTRQAGNLLTKASWWCGGIFIGLSFILQISASRGRVPTSVLDKSFATPKAAPAAPKTAPAGGAVPAPTVPLQTIPSADAKQDAKPAAPAEPVKKP
ncbi:MAG: preprotein translocase subunit SecG [Gemmatimonadetes bacterium]|nr:preprotein translocase subunit SecG [Gemmatimonadota bacterium]